MRKTLRIALVLVGFYMAVWCVGEAIKAYMNRPPRNASWVLSDGIDDAVVVFAASVNARTPLRIDESTVLDRVVAGPGKTLTYNYMVKDVFAKELDEARLAEFRNAKTLDRIQEVKQNLDFRHFRAYGVTFRFTYRDGSSNEFANILVTPADYATE